MATPTTGGFRGLTYRQQGDEGNKYLNGRAKLGGSVRVIKKDSVLIAGAGNTIDLANITGGVNAAQTLTPGVGGATGTYTLTVTINGVAYVTAALSFSATLSQMQAAIDAAFNTAANPLNPNSTLKPKIGLGNVVLSAASNVGLFNADGSVGNTVTVTYRGILGSRPQTTIARTLTGFGTGTITAAAGTLGTYGYCSSTSLLGLSNEWDNGPTTSFPREFPQAPPNLDGPYASSAREMLYVPFDTPGLRFYAAIEPFVAVTAALVGTTKDIGHFVDIGQFYISTLTTSAANVEITGILPGQLGVYGGLVECELIAANVDRA